MGEAQSKIQSLMEKVKQRRAVNSQDQDASMDGLKRSSPRMMAQLQPKVKEPLQEGSGLQTRICSLEHKCGRLEEENSALRQQLEQAASIARRLAPAAAPDSPAVPYERLPTVSPQHFRIDDTLSRTPRMWDAEDVGAEDHKIVGALVCRPSQSDCAATMMHRTGFEEPAGEQYACEPEAPRSTSSATGGSWQDYIVPSSFLGCGGMSASHIFPCQRAQVVRGHPNSPYPMSPDSMAFSGLSHPEACPGLMRSVDAVRREAPRTCIDIDGAIDCSKSHHEEVAEFVCRPSASRPSRKGLSREITSLPQGI